MTNKEAITMLQGSACTPVMRRAINKGIEALQEREERSKGCEYCTGVVLNVVDETTVLEAGFNFCPMCGRKLPEPPKEE